MYIYKNLKMVVIYLFGDRLKELRKKNNITQDDIAKMFDISFSTVSAWEVGKAQPSYDVLIKLAEYFNVTTDYLLGFNQNDLDKIDKLKIALKEAGMMVGDDMTAEEFEKALKIVEVMKDQN